MTIYISGATGYLGTFLSRSFQLCNVHFNPISFYNPYNPFYISDISSLDSCSTIIHLSDNSIPSRANDASYYSDTPLLSCLSSEFKRVIYFSSSCVYDTSSSDSLFTEFSDSFSSSSYSRQKLFLESCLDATKDLIIRPTNLYYDYPKNGTILSDLYQQKISNRPYELIDPDVFIDFIDCRFVFDFLLYALDNSLTGIYNLACGEYISGHQLISLFSNPYQSSSLHDNTLPSPFCISKLKSIPSLPSPSSILSFKPYFIFS